MSDLHLVMNSFSNDRVSLEVGVAVVPSNVFYPQEQYVEPALRLNFTHSNVYQLQLTASRLARVLYKVAG